ncbi:TPR domain protein [Aspergillus homomorphus CBS 101889]|uniref:TPR domain protein n=1 Tax=Aspergillus homomorphus (strain CBS 101889) TaxID=1450537 RepID=A0A395HPE2_ASPHC|nr:hypothetical protein BO97DRAFT_398895 [Aspergillus homomorphus CBS 101889]RAL08134.1 hypothetical protein BO97DRAFT_398895 [Aspergillus homomorphus CBS 101889]
MLSTLPRRATSALPRLRTLPAHHAQPFSTTRLSLRPRLTTNTTTLLSLQSAPTPKTLIHSPLTTPQARRTLTTAQKWKLGFRKARKDIWRKNPILLPLAILSVVTATGLFAYIAYVEVTQVAPQYTKFPPPMAERLRTAVYYTEVDLQPSKALKAYQDAYKIGIEMGLHPFSDEMVGVRLQIAHMFEKAGLVSAAVSVLEQTRQVALQWVQRSRKERPDEEGRPVIAAELDSAKLAELSPELAAEVEARKESEAWEDRQVNKVLKKIVGISMKIAELCDSDYIQDSEKAEQNQSYAVQLCLKEMQRRVDLGLPVGNKATTAPAPASARTTETPDNTTDNTDEDDGWMNLEEIATALADLATHYYNQGKPELSMPLFIRALDVVMAAEKANPTCKVPLLMASIGASMGDLALASKAPPGVVTERKTVIAGARKWLERATASAANVDPKGQDAQCTEACVAALRTLGELARFENQSGDAKKFYQDALSAARRLEDPAMTEDLKAALKAIKTK